MHGSMHVWKNIGYNNNIKAIRVILIFFKNYPDLVRSTMDRPMLTELKNGFLFYIRCVLILQMLFRVLLHTMTSYLLHKCA